MLQRFVDRLAIQAALIAIAIIETGRILFSREIDWERDERDVMKHEKYQARGVRILEHAQFNSIAFYEVVIDYWVTDHIVTVVDSIYDVRNSAAKRARTLYQTLDITYVPHRFDQLPPSGVPYEARRQ